MVGGRDKREELWRLSSEVTEFHVARIVEERWIRGSSS
jgi:hypothetical protein